MKQGVHGELTAPEHGEGHAFDKELWLLTGEGVGSVTAAFYAGASLSGVPKASCRRTNQQLNDSFSV
jgi:hypothetical protein